MSFQAATYHKANVLEIAAGAAAEDRKPLLAVLYDEVLRQELESKSSRLGGAFSVNEHLQKLSDEVLRRARKVHDQMLKTVRSPVRGSHWKQVFCIMCFLFCHAFYHSVFTGRGQQKKMEWRQP